MVIPRNTSSETSRFDASAGASSFWKDGAEVDMVLDGAPVEVKYQETITRADLAGVEKFMKRFNQTRGLIITKKDAKTAPTSSGIIQFVPLWKWLLAWRD